MQEFMGLGVALVTPFNENLSIDFDSLTKLVEFNIQNGTNYLVISGTTGESATITKEEKSELVKHIAKVNNKRLPLVLGIGGNNTQEIIHELQNSDLTEIDAILSVVPYYSKPTQEGFYQHFKAIAEASTKPIILYNVPGRTAKNMLPETTIRLANDFHNIIGIKEAGNNVQQYLELLRNKPKGFLIISGDDDLALPVILAGAAGVISVIGQAYPKEFSKLIALGLQGENKESFQIHFKLMDIVGFIFEENNPAGIKNVLKQLFIIDDYVRLPLVKVSTDLSKKIGNFISEF